MKPTGRLLDGAEYIPALKTNVQATWRKFGWVPPSEQKQKSRVITLRHTLVGPPDPDAQIVAFLK
jgi:hypothetical protein